MIANYHTHTPRCNHALGTETQYAQTAVDCGMKILGFSDHTPQFFPGDYYSRMRMRPWQLKDYCQEVLQVKEAFKDKLQIHLGLEVEYYPSLFAELRDVLLDTPVEYMILGQHWCQDEEGQPYNGRPTDNEKQLKQYCNQVIDAMHTGAFTYIAHPDVLNYTGSDRIYTRHIRRLCKAAKACCLPLELNLLGVAENRHYPNRRFWEIAAGEGCTAIIGSDAHRPEDLYLPQAEASALALAKELGLRVCDTVTLQKI